MKRGGEAVIMVGMLLMAISGCSRGNIKAVSIDEHVFKVPHGYLIEGTIPWLPASQHDGLMFTINPEASLPERVSVLVQSTAITCPAGEPLGSTPLASACHEAAQHAGRGATKQSIELEKVYSSGSSTPWDGKPTPWWNYRVKDRSGKEQGDVVATCSAIANGNGLCHAYGTYSNLVYSVGLRDSEIGHLPTIRTKIEELLSSWEKAPH
jgi:hypothetical protein